MHGQRQSLIRTVYVDSDIELFLHQFYFILGVNVLLQSLANYVLFTFIVTMTYDHVLNNWSNDK